MQHCRRGHEIKSSQDLVNGGCRECHRIKAREYQRRYRAKHREMRKKLESLGLDIESEG